MPIANLQHFQGNLKNINPQNLAKLKANIIKNGFVAPIFIWQDPKGVNNIVDGHQRVKAVQCLLEEGYTLQPAQVNQGLPSLPYIGITAASAKQAAELVLTYNSQYGSILDMEGFCKDFGLNMEELSNTTLCLDGWQKQVVEEEQKRQANARLRQDWVVPPFSILDSRLGYWQERKADWDKLINGAANNNNGTASTATREGALGGTTGLIASINQGVSVFDPVLAEIIFKWFCPKGGHILNLFAGDMEPNIVAAVKGYKLTGIELRKEQVACTTKVLENLKVNNKVNIICGDVAKLKTLLPQGVQYDLLFSCPPYYDLEEYSALEDDFANKEEDEFDKLMEQAVANACGKLGPNRFAVFVVGEVRGSNGAYRGLVPKVIHWFKQAGLHYYNEIILVNSIGTLPLRINNAWQNRKVGKMHQNVLVFYKGNINKIKEVMADG